MPPRTVGPTAAALPWLCPRTDSLVALADEPSALPLRARQDPALALFLLRFSSVGQAESCGWLHPETLASPRLPAIAAAFLRQQRCGILPWHSYSWNQLWQWSIQAARQAEALANRCRLAPAEQAYFAALLAPLGWYAVAAVDCHAIGDVLFDPQASTNPRQRQSQTWGIDHVAIARRLAIRWHLPAWLADLCGILHLPWSSASVLFQPPQLLAIVQWAWQELRANEPAVAALGMLDEIDRSQLSRYLGLCVSSAQQTGYAREARQAVTTLQQLPKTAEPLKPPEDPFGDNPYQVPLLTSLLQHAAGHRRQSAPELLSRLQDEVDRLHQTIERLGFEASRRLQEAKMAAVAEFAAGAAHEINNPLAIITAHVQRLLRQETDPQKRESCQVILKQAQRIADLLRDVLTFARPPRPQPTALPLPELLLIVRKQLQPVLDRRRLTYEVEAEDATLSLHVDPRQIQQAVTAVLRNAAEAAPEGGWIRLQVEADDVRIRFVIEDNGPGLSEEAARHAFDPFYSEKEAGRGRGLGLPLAWRLVRENGGDIVYAPLPDAPGRFLISLPRHCESALPLRQSA